MTSRKLIDPTQSVRLLNDNCEDFLHKLSVLADWAVATTRADLGNEIQILGHCHRKFEASIEEILINDHSLDDSAEAAGAAEAGADADAAEGHNEDRAGGDAGEGVHGDVAVELRVVLKLKVLDRWGRRLLKVQRR